MLTCLPYAIYHKFKKKQLNSLTLLPIEESSTTLDLSISNVSNNDFTQFVNILGNFLSENNVNERTKYHVELCCDELLTNILKYAYKNPSKRYIDVNVQINPDNNISLNIKDNGLSFNPLKHQDSENIGLLIVKGICKDISYQRTNGQNMVFVKF